MRYEDLPAKARAQVDAKLGRKEQTKGRREVGGACPYRCHECKQKFPSFDRKGGAEHHSRETGHVRQEMVIP